MLYSFHWESDWRTEYLCSGLSKFYYIASLSRVQKDGQYTANIYTLDNQIVTLKDSNINILKIKTELEYMNLVDQYNVKTDNRFYFEKKDNLLYAS